MPPHKNAFVEIPTPSTSILGYKFFENVIKLNWGRKCGALVQYYLCPYTKRNSTDKQRGKKVI